MDTHLYSIKSFQPFLVWRNENCIRDMNIFCSFIIAPTIFLSILQKFYYCVFRAQPPLHCYYKDTMLSQHNFINKELWALFNANIELFTRNICYPCLKIFLPVIALIRKTYTSFIHAVHANIFTSPNSTKQNILLWYLKQREATQMREG